MNHENEIRNEYVSITNGRDLVENYITLNKTNLELIKPGKLAKEIFDFNSKNRIPFNNKKLIKENPFVRQIAAISVGVYKGTPVLDLDYPEDSKAETDMNVVMDEHGNFIEIQGTAEAAPFSPDEMSAMTALAQKGISELIEKQTASLNS